jgi:hypothetical protein
VVCFAQVVKKIIRPNINDGAFDCLEVMAVWHGQIRRLDVLMQSAMRCE